MIRRLKYTIIKLLVLLLFHRVLVCAFFDNYRVELTNNGPAVIGSNVTFTAVLYENGKRPDTEYTYFWRDNLYPQNRGNGTANSEFNWTVNYHRDIYKAGYWGIEVNVFEPKLIIDWPVCSNRSVFVLSDTLVGELVSKQNITSVTPGYLSNAVEVVHEVMLHQPDAEFLKNVTSVIAYWYMDCVLIANTTTTQLSLHYNYTKADVSHSITAFVLASNSTITADTSTEIDIISSTGAPMQITSINNTTNSTTDNTKFSYETMNTSVQNVNIIPPPPFSCPTNKVEPMDEHHTYGTFSTKVKIKAPVQNVKIQGTGWLQHGEMLDLLVTCNGSAPFLFCTRMMEGDYNVTGHENCQFFRGPTPKCQFPVAHYFSDSTHYTVLLILQNDINKYVVAFGVDVYEVTKHPQVSIIIVPVTAGLLAVVLIIFGIAYYIQNRNRYIIEVADFDFSNTNDMEYKTFRERLVEAIHDAFNKTEEFSEQDSYNEPSTNKKYGSMQ